MKKIMILLVSFLMGIRCLQAQAPAKQAHDNLMVEMGKEKIVPEDLTILESRLQQTEFLAAQIRKTIQEFDTRAERKLAQRKKEYRILKKQLKKERSEMIYYKEQQERTLTKYVIHLEKDLKELIAQREKQLQHEEQKLVNALSQRDNDLQKFDKKMEAQLRKQQAICYHLENRINEKREQLVHNLSVTEKQLAKNKELYALTEKRTEEYYNKFYDQFAYIRSYLIQHEADLKKEAQKIVSTYKEKRRSSERMTIINTELKPYIEQLNTLLMPLNGTPSAILQTTKGKILINNIGKTISPVLNILNELFIAETNRLKQVAIKSIHSKRLYSLYDCLQKPFKSVGLTHPDAQKNIAVMDDTFKKLGLPLPE